ncbi:MAG: hypothetical protein IJM15_08795 [Erysipelotrichaceae bacterium]|nr:hypothetical protein [Erysipelotrichaceae bacterium]
MIHAQITMRSVVLEMDTKVDVLLPEDRHKTEDLRGKKYPVLYVLHGYKDDNASWLHLSNIFLMCRDLDLIVVFPSVHNSFYADMKYGFDYYTYVVEELPMKLKNYLPITDDPKQTFVMGNSMGGYGTLKLALGNPDKFGKAVALSGGLINRRISDNKLSIGAYGSQEEYEKSDNNLVNLVKKLQDYKGDLPELRIYCGTEDRAIEGCLAMADLLRNMLPQMKVNEEYWKGEHNFQFWNEAIPKALNFFGFEIKQNSVI